jgi:hypothetical protein
LQGTTQLNTGNFDTDGIGLLDMNKLIKYQIDLIKPELVTAETKIASAKVNVTNLQNIVESLNR